MGPVEFQKLLRQTLDDRRLSRGERQTLSAILKDLSPSPEDLEQFQRMAFELARDVAGSGPDREVIDWLEDVLKQLRLVPHASPRVLLPEVYFSPGEECRRRICSLCRQARESIDVCVFTITDDDIADALAAAHRRQVAIRLITDDEKAQDPGSDTLRLQELGLAVRVDQTEHHMHHKFAIFDGTILLTGSYNWTRSAAQFNEENIVVVGDCSLVESFQKEFDRLWKRLG